LASYSAASHRPTTTTTRLFGETKCGLQRIRLTAARLPLAGAVTARLPLALPALRFLISLKGIAISDVALAIVAILAG